MFDTFLEHQYSPSKWVVRSFENGQDVVQNFCENGLKAREKAITECTNCDLDIEYSDGKKTKLDIFYPGNLEPSNYDVLIFIHGGYWQCTSKEEYSFLAPQVKALDCIVVLPGYDLAPDESMDGIVQQIKLALCYTAKKFPDSRLFLCGHSAGAHLSAMMLNIEWEDSIISMKNRLTGTCLISGIYDLVPLLSTSVNQPLKMDRKTALRNSPLTITASGSLKLHCKILVMIGEHDSPEFHRQSEEYCELLKQKLPSVAFLEIPGVDHFDLMEKCVEKDYHMIKAIHDFMKR